MKILLPFTVINALRFLPRLSACTIYAGTVIRLPLRSFTAIDV